MDAQELNPQDQADDTAIASEYAAGNDILDTGAQGEAGASDTDGFTAPTDYADPSPDFYQNAEEALATADEYVLDPSAAKAQFDDFMRRHEERAARRQAREDRNEALYLACLSMSGVSHSTQELFARADEFRAYIDGPTVH